jgi:hypothetical protein
MKNKYYFLIPNLMEHCNFDEKFPNKPFLIVTKNTVWLNALMIALMYYCMNQACRACNPFGCNISKSNKCELDSRMQ